MLLYMSSLGGIKLKSYDELKEERKGYIVDQIRNAEQAKVGASHSVVVGIDMGIAEWKDTLEHIDEYVAYVIGDSVSRIISAMKEFYVACRDKYEYYFDETIMKHLSGFVNMCGCDNFSGFYMPCNILGMTPEMIARCFQGKNPMDPEVCDAFISMVNVNFGSNVPLSGELENAEKVMNAAHENKEEDPVTFAKAHVEWYEKMRDSGKGGSGFWILSTNPSYQKAKEKAEGKQY